MSGSASHGDSSSAAWPTAVDAQRRRLLSDGARITTGLLLPVALAGCTQPMSATTPRPLAPRSAPFTLGVASGEPTPTSVLLWTRLLPDEFDPADLPAVAIAVRWELADDEGFSRSRRGGTVSAEPARAHSVHVEVNGLAPDRWYFYRFHCGDYTSPTGRTRTLPQPQAAGSAAGLRFALASCQHYESGFYAAHRHLAAEAVDLVWFVGDYIYEYGPAPADRPAVRRHDRPECRSLADYRRRYALYKRDTDLQAMHASAPFLPIWDDHEVDNDYAGLMSRDHDPAFAARRAAAYRAYVEHMPLSWSRVSAAGDTTLHRQVDYGRLVRFHALDLRQYRDEQACSPAGQGAGYVALDACPERLSPARSMLGAAQERWLDDSLAGSGARWNLITQQTLMAPAIMNRRVWRDGWDGYPAARQRLLDALARPSVSNPIVIGGDVHATYVADLHRDPHRPDSPLVAREFCGTSISSSSWSQASSDRLVRDNPWYKFARSDRRGYLLFELRSDRLRVTMRALDDARRRDAAVESFAQWEVENDFRRT